METRRCKLFDNSGVNVTAETLLRPVLCLRGGMRFDAISVFIPAPIAPRENLLPSLGADCRSKTFRRKRLSYHVALTMPGARFVILRRRRP